MRNLLPIAIAQVPGVQQLVESLVDDLAQRRSLLMLLPMGIDPVLIWPRLRRELWRRDFSVREIFLPDLPEGMGPMAALGSTLEVDWGPADTPHTITNLIKVSPTIDVIQLMGVDLLSATKRQEWLLFLVQWAQASQSAVGRGRSQMAFCVLVPATTVLSYVPESNLYLGVRWCWGFLSMLEMRLLCRLASQDDDWTLETRWREYLLPALVGGDVLLAEYLWDDLQLNSDDLAEHLYSFAEKRGWSSGELRAWGAERIRSLTGNGAGQQVLVPSSDVRRLWASGALIWTLEYGWELHPAALAVLGWKEELRHRLWRGQSELLLPLVDHTRLSICDRLTRTYTRDWPIRWCEPESPEEKEAVRRDPMACQWGHLEWLLRNCRELRAEQHLRALATIARWIRNELAHYRPVSFADFLGLWREIQRVIIRGGPSW